MGKFTRWSANKKKLFFGQPYSGVLNKKVKVLAAGESFKDIYNQLMETINDEDDGEIKSNLLAKLSNILSMAKSEADKVAKLKTLMRKFRIKI